ncbi:MAG: hypothetical protein JNK72_04050 [Myxococcales bacterium]|nr:hypothetical protein [Myxococcales bacterium]
MKSLVFRLFGFGALAALVAASGCTSREVPRGQCSFDTECEAPLVCISEFCRASCSDANPCPSGMNCVAAPGGAVRICVPGTEEPTCQYASDCPASTTCTRDGRCQSECRTSYDCNVINPYLTCQSGTCELICPSGFSNCDGDRRNGCEAELATSLNHCGACGNVCRPGPNATASCAAGRCQYACAQGFADCDGNPENGCEADLSRPETCGACNVQCTGSAALCVREGASARCASSCGGETPTACGASCVDLRRDPNHCGQCDQRCPSGPNAEASCVEGRCVARCSDTQRYADCDQNAANGCEAELPRDASNCGACGVSCQAGSNGQPACMTGQCAITCQTSFGDCDGNRDNGCETNLGITATACGMCGRACSAPANAAPTCVEGRCGFSCAPGFADCNNDPADGCEVNTNANASNCGQCGNLCNRGLVCSSGSCVSNCTGSTTNCDGVCADLQSNVSHCGGCGRVCQAPANASARCASGACSFACNAGFGDCDGNPANGCETSLATTASSCGACGRACSLANATPVCSASQCAVASCNAGFGNCDGNAANGCETNLTSTVSACGACGRACSLANATAACASGRCTVAACNAGFGDCDGDPANGCETNLATSPLHCGRCANACPSANGTAACASGACTLGCNAGFGNCDNNVANGCETNLTSTATSCGACGRACALSNATAACASSQCAIAACNAGFGNCDNNAANGCETNLSSTVSACGACGRACSLANATPACMSGQCAIGACATGFANCDNNTANGCETNTNTTPSACGMCGRVCALANATAGCTNGACSVASCNAGFGNCDNNAANGCETNLNTTTAHCGACGRACGSGQVCSNGTCSNICQTPLTFCSGSCVNTASDPAHCGACGTTCPAVSNGTAACARSACTIGSCNPGFASCDGNNANGCETNLTNTVAHCGACNALCAPANAVAACLGGACGIASCNAGFGNCDGNPANGCETNLTSTVTSCGRCGNVCNLANATATCAGGACAVLRCNAGFGDCDGNPANGCEVDLNTSAVHCGACNAACAGTNVVGSACSAGACVGTCAAGYLNCDGDLRRNGCEVRIDDPNNCGACGNSCARPNVATPTCTRSVIFNGYTCGIGACTAGFANCNGSVGDGCEVNLTSDSANCGACGSTCDPQTRETGYAHTCQASTCRPVNDLCANATAINLAQGPQLTLRGVNTYAAPGPNLAASCDSFSGRDLFYVFTLTQREIVFASTAGNAAFDTVLHFASSCSASMSNSGAPSGVVYCNDDLTSTNCTNEPNERLRSMVTAVLAPGTYYLVLGGHNGGLGAANVVFEHYPVGNGTVRYLDYGSQRQTGSLTGTGSLSGTCGGASGNEITYWMRGCPSTGRTSFNASTCESGTNYDTVLYTRAVGFQQCNDDYGQCTMNPRASVVNSITVSGQGLRLVTVDSYNSTGGAYTVAINFNVIITDRQRPRSSSACYAQTAAERLDPSARERLGSAPDHGDPASRPWDERSPSARLGAGGG